MWSRGDEQCALRGLNKDKIMCDRNRDEYSTSYHTRNDHSMNRTLMDRNLLTALRRTTVSYCPGACEASSPGCPTPHFTDIL